MKPLAIDLFTGLHGWADGLIAEGFRVVGFDLEDMSAQFGQPKPPNFNLVIQDVLTLHGSQFRDAALIVASPPCQAYSYRAMPWSRAKALPPPCNALFEACFRIQREAIEAAGHHIPLIVENVRGAQPWVGRARWAYGSFYLWGDVPALMPCISSRAILKPQATNRRHGTGSWFAIDMKSARAGITNPSDIEAARTDGLKQPGIDLSEVGFNCANAREFSHMVEGVEYRRTEDDKRQHIGVTRKFASAMIAKIPLPLSRHIAAVFR